MEVVLSASDIDALARTSMSEVGHFGQYGSDVLKGGVEAVVDTIINRVVHPSFPDTVPAVVDARYQFSAIGGPGGTGTWSRLRRASEAVLRIVEVHMAERVNGKACTVKGATHFLNPNFASQNALRAWGNYVVQHSVAIWGRRRDVHYHGFAPGVGFSPPYGLVFNGRRRSFVGDGTPVEGFSDEGSSGGGQIVEPPSLEDQQGSTRAYRVENVVAGDAAVLQSALNGLLAEGWSLRQIISVGDRLMIVTEGVDQDDIFDESDEGEAPPAVGDPADAADAYLQDFKRFLIEQDASLRYFKPKEFLVLGGQNAAGRCAGKNRRPPRELWRNIVPTAKVLDELRERLGAAIELSSVYRSPEYNACIPGSATGSMHMEFRAADFTCEDGRGPVWWATRLKEMRDAGVFRGGIGVYQTFVHVDTRGRNANFGPWMNWVF